MKNFLKLLKIDESSLTPKYTQLVNCMISAIERGQVVQGDLLPSIYDLSLALNISKNTTERFYNELKQSRIIATIHGKGTYISNTRLDRQLRVLLLFNKLSTHKKTIYDAFTNSLGHRAKVDLCVYNSDFNTFRTILSEKMPQNYDKYVILPYFLDREDKAVHMINRIPKKKLVIMDKMLMGISGHFSAVFENFELDIYFALSRLIDKFKKYKTLKLIFPRNSYYPEGICLGFINFCCDHSFRCEIIHELSEKDPVCGDAYIAIAEEDLVSLIQKLQKTTLVVGQDVGIVSYNETDLKRIILNGITTISTDFSYLGAKSAEVLLDGNIQHFIAPFVVTERLSL